MKKKKEAKTLFEKTNLSLKAWEKSLKEPGVSHTWDIPDSDLDEKLAKLAREDKELVDTVKPDSHFGIYQYKSGLYVILDGYLDMDMREFPKEFQDEFCKIILEKI